MIYVFRTSVTSKKMLRRLKPQLDNICSGGSWNFDLEDRDNILRLGATEALKMKVVSLLKSMDIFCEEL